MASTRNVHPKVGAAKARVAVYTRDHRPPEQIEAARAQLAEATDPGADRYPFSDGGGLCGGDIPTAAVAAVAAAAPGPLSFPVYLRRGDAPSPGPRWLMP